MNDIKSNTIVPINPDPDCPHCDGTGFSCQHRSGYALTSACQCSANRLSEEHRQLYSQWRW
jgi:hypothetical protein